MASKKSSGALPVGAILFIGLLMYANWGTLRSAGHDLSQKLNSSTTSSSEQFNLATSGVGKGGPFGSAVDTLDTLAVRAKKPIDGYEREEDFGSPWLDSTGAPMSGNSCDTRNDILVRDMINIVYRQGDYGCVVATGTLSDPYTRTVIDFTRGVGTSGEVQIDHVVALGNAWQTGAQKLDESKRFKIANDPLNLLAVDGPANESKGKRDASGWLPENRKFRCSYVARQIAVKAKYDLWVTKSEKKTMEKVLGTCPDQGIPVE